MQEELKEAFRLYDREGEPIAPYFRYGARQGRGEPKCVS
jgi:hypothetical protein